MPHTTIHTASWLANPHTEPISGGAIAVCDGIIVATGTAHELSRTLAATTIHHPGCAIIPGFVNAHTHLELTHFPAWRDQNGMGYSPRNFVDWIIQLIKINRGLSAKQLQASLKEGMRKCIQSGTTMVGDILSRYELLPHYASHPLGGRIFFEILGHDRLLFNSRLEDAQSAIDSMGDNDQMLPALSPHAAYTISEEFLPLIREVAHARHIPLAIHISESEAENMFMYDSTGIIADELYSYVHWQQHLKPPRHCSATDFFVHNGLLSEKTMAVHCVHLTLEDAKKIKEQGTTICLCPRSNERLDVGIAPVALFKKLGIPLALGTDSLASNDSLSLWDEMRFALDQFGGVLSPDDLFAMVTAGGAAALNLADQAGSLGIGKRADFQVVEVSQSVTGETLVAKLVEQGDSSAVYVTGTCTEYEPEKSI